MTYRFARSKDSSDKQYLSEEYHYRKADFDVDFVSMPCSPPCRGTPYRLVEYTTRPEA
jgi:hypothetical protein